MARIVLRKGKTLVYSDVQGMTANNGMVALEGKNRKEDYYLIALIPVDIIERAEYEKPCKTYRHLKKKPAQKKRRKA